jgi:glycosyltransferase involved in cell wall biosynthesis
MDNIKISIIIPCLNEERYLSDTINATLKLLSMFDFTYQIIIVDDFSSDRTFSIAYEYSQTHPYIICFKNEKNEGLGGSYFKALNYCRGEYITWIPGDNSHPSESLFDSYNKINFDYDLIIPIPKNKEVRNYYRRIISYFYIKIIQILSGHKIPYFNGLTIYRSTILKSLKTNSSGFGFQAELLVSALNNGCNYIITETYISDRNEGKSKAFNLINLFSVINSLIKITLMRRNILK